MKNYFCIFLWEELPEKEGVQLCLGRRGGGGGGGAAVHSVKKPATV